jgi:glutathione S-transferase
MYPQAEPARRRALKISALATGMSDKAVALFYEQQLHKTVSDVWVARCRGQILGALAMLEADRAARRSDYWFGDHIGHADITVACVLRHMNDAHPGLVSMEDYRALKAHCERLEALPVFRTISQAFIPPA